MALVELDTVYLHDAADLSDFVMLDVESLVEEPEMGGDFRRRAGGRVQLIRRKGRHRRFSVQAVQVSRDTVDWLREHIGSTLLLRDPRQRKAYGAYLEVSVDEVPAVDMAVVSFTFGELTHSESVA